MKYPLLPLLLCLALVSCTQSERIDPLRGDPVKIDPAKPPEGMLLVQILLENQSLPVKGTGCESSGLSPDNRRLQHKLAMTIGYSFDSPHHYAVLLGGCEADQVDLPSGSVIDIWLCKLAVVEKNKKGEDITSSIIYFGIKKDNWAFIPEKLLCL